MIKEKHFGQITNRRSTVWG